MESAGTSDKIDLRKLIGRKVQINYVSPASEEATITGRLLEVAADIIVVDGPVMKTQMYRKQMKIISIDYVPEPHDVLVLNMTVHKGVNKLTSLDWQQIGAMIKQGLTKGKDAPKGINFEVWASP